MKSKLSYTERVLNIWAIAMIAWSFYRAAFKADLGIWFDELVAKPVFFILPLYIFITKFEKKKLFASIGLKAKSAWLEVFIGLVVGLGFLGAVLLLGKVQPYLDKKLLWLVVPALATAITEVVLSQGFVLERLLKGSKGYIIPVIYASVLNFFLNVPLLFTTQGLTGTILMQVLVLQLSLNLALSFLYVYRRSVYAPIMIKFLYLLTVYTFM